MRKKIYSFALAMCAMFLVTGCNDAAANNHAGQTAAATIRGTVAGTTQVIETTESAEQLSRKAEEESQLAEDISREVERESKEAASKEAAEASKKAEESKEKLEEASRMQEKAAAEIQSRAQAKAEAEEASRVQAEADAAAQAKAEAEAASRAQAEAEAAAKAKAEAESIAAAEAARKKIPKNIAFLGDSITAGYYCNGPTYCELVCREFGAVQYNYGISGNTIASCDGNGFVDRYKRIFAGADVIVVYGGINDFYQNVRMGNADSWNKNEFYGALNILCKGLKENYPNATIIFMTALPANLDGKPSSTPNDADCTIQDYNYAIRVMCSQYGIAVEDIYQKYGMATPDYAGQLADGLHPSADGHAQIARLLIQCIKSLKSITQ